jgi:hypothetical protein
MLRSIGMPQRSEDAANARARAEALFKRREQKKAEAPVAMAEYRAAQQAALERMHELRRLRLAREAEAGRQALGRPEERPPALRAT